MKLKDMKRIARGAQVMYRAPATDRKGQSHYEVSVEGHKGAVEKAGGDRCKISSQPV